MYQYRKCMHTFVVRLRGMTVWWCIVLDIKSWWAHSFFQRIIQDYTWQLRDEEKHKWLSNVEKYSKSRLIFYPKASVYGDVTQTSVIPRVHEAQFAIRCKKRFLIAFVWSNISSEIDRLEEGSCCWKRTWVHGHYIGNCLLRMRIFSPRNPTFVIWVRVLKDFRWFIRHHSSVVESAALKKVSNP